MITKNLAIWLIFRVKLKFYLTCENCLKFLVFTDFLVISHKSSHKARNPNSSEYITSKKVQQHQR